MSRPGDRIVRCVLVGSGFALVAFGVGLMRFAEERQDAFGAQHRLTGWLGSGSTSGPGSRASAQMFGWGVVSLTLGAAAIGVAVPLLLEQRREPEVGPELIQGHDDTQRGLDNLQ